MKIPIFIGIIKYSSIEVALGATVMCMALADALVVEVPGLVYWALFIAVWFIYLLDRLLDAKKIHAVAMNQRHLFYQQYQVILVNLLLLIGLAGLILLPQLPIKVFLYGATLMGVCLLYLLWVFFSARSLPKEVLVSVLYSAGISLAPRALSPHPLGVSEVMIFTIILLIAFINLVLFSRLEQTTDIQDGQPTFITYLDSRQARVLLLCVFSIAAACLFILAFAFSHKATALTLVLLLMLAVLWVLFWQGDRIRNNGTYRLLGDGIFLFPAVLLF